MTGSRITVKVEGIKDVIGRIDDLQSFRRVRAILASAAQDIRKHIMAYPPYAGDNKPGPYPARWYERGYGPKWALKGGGEHGRQTSQTLGRRWNVEARNYGLTQSIGNNVPYAKFVHSREDQAAIHERSGWQTVEDVAEKEAPALVRWINDMLEKMFK